MSKKIVVSGGTGFIGSHFVEHIQKNTDWEIHVLASFRHRGDSERVAEAFDPNRTTIHFVDLNGPISKRLAIKIGRPDYIVNMASESHVDRSIADPVPFVQNNVNTALYMLEYAREVRPDKFIQCSTDEVFGPVHDHLFKEWDRHVPSNPYSASKSAQEAIAISYWRTFDLPIIITNTMNNFGEMQDSEKFIPMTIKKILKGEEVIVHADKDGVPGSRFYLHARNHADALLFILNNIAPLHYRNGFVKPERFNISGDVEVNNLEMVKLLAKILGKPAQYVLALNPDRPGHDLRYGLDGAKLRKAGWKPPVDFESSMKKYIEWTLAHKEWL